MKRIIVVLFLALIMIGSVAVAEDGQAYINIGDYNETVKTLHQKLADLGYYYLRAESPWSEASVSAVMQLQDDRGLEPTGVVENQSAIEEIMSLDHVIRENLLLGTNQGITNYSISKNGFETELTSPDGREVKVTIISKSEDAAWLTLLYNDGRSKEVLAGPAGEQYTLSFEAKSNVDNFNIRASHKQVDAKENQIDFGSASIGTEWQTITLTGSLTGVDAAGQGLYLDLRYNSAGTGISIRNLKLERGTLATEWSPAAED